MLSRNSAVQKNNISTSDSVTAKNIALITKTENKLKTTEIACDTVYKNKGYKITITTFDTTISDYDTAPNSIFALHKELHAQDSILFVDSIHTMFQEVQFADFNGDNVKDILVQNISDVRSNQTYYLYLVDTTHDRLTKIKGFEEIKNPNYVSKYNLIDNYVMSGKDRTSFYKIKGDTVKDFDIVIYDDHLDDGTYDRDYKNAIKKILRAEKNNR